MFNSNEFSEKYVVLFRCPDDINNFKIKITLTEADINNKGVNRRGDGNDEVKTEVQCFSWQEKVYGKYERDFYKDEKNCVTDLDKKYHEDVIQMNEGNNKIFSYTNEDCLDVNEELYVKKNSVVTVLEKQMLKLEKNGDRNIEYTKTKEYDFRNSLLTSFEQPVLSNDFEQMLIVIDVGDYVDDTWIKSEHILCCIKYDKSRKILQMRPDFSKGKPYLLQVENDTTKNYFYYIENASEQMADDIVLKENQMLNKLILEKSKINSEIIGNDFYTPPKTRLDVYLFIEICSAKNFEYNNIYVQYFIDLPENWTCDKPQFLTGTTQSCQEGNFQNLAHFGHSFELSLHFDLQQLKNNEPLNSPYIYFEVVSKDTWSRYRTEGLTYKALPILQPGVHVYDLQCLRVTTGKPSGELRRFFIGDCSSYNDITWTGIPRDLQGSVLNKFGAKTIGTGQIKFRCSAICQSPGLFRKGLGDIDESREKHIFERLSASALVKSVEEVLKAFKEAKKKMLEAREGV